MSVMGFETKKFGCGWVVGLGELYASIQVYFGTCLTLQIPLLTVHYDIGCH